MKRFIKVSLMVIISILLVLSVSSIHASSPYITKTLDRFGKWQETQDAYEPELLVKPIFDEKTLNGAQDLVIDEDDFIYIADTGNKRILILDADYNPIYSFGNDKLIKPQGLFKKGDKIYIADYGDIAKADTGRIYIYSYDKNLNEATFIKELARPSSAILEADNFVYRPQKIVVDDKETMYVISEASQQGVLMINKENRFINFFASNSVKYTFWQTILRFLYQNNQEYLNK